MRFHDSIHFGHSNQVLKSFPQRFATWFTIARASQEATEARDPEINGVSVTFPRDQPIALRKSYTDPNNADRDLEVAPVLLQADGRHVERAGRGRGCKAFAFALLTPAEFMEIGIQHRNGLAGTLRRRAVGGSGAGAKRSRSCVV